MESTIPKIIHYCWFGGNPLPELAVKCIDSWKKYFPDYKIKEWNESNFDFNCCDYVREAYEAKKWAFVSDYARFWILYRYGGLYFDTDVEVIKDMRDIVEKGPFMGREPDLETRLQKATDAANPGLGLAAAPGLGLYKEVLDDYEHDHFILDTSGFGKTVVTRTTDILKRHDFSDSDDIQIIEGIYIYPSEFFCPMNYNTGEITITDNTRSIHHYTESWLTGTQKRVNEIRRQYAAKGKSGCFQERLQTLPLRIKNKFERLGLVGTIKYAVKKIFKSV